MYLIGIEAPELEFLLEQRTTHVGRVMQLASPVIVEYLSEDARMSVEEILVEYRVVVGQRFGEARQPRGRDLLERRLIRLVADTTHVEDHSVLRVRHGQVVGSPTLPDGYGGHVHLCRVAGNTE